MIFEATLFTGFAGQSCVNRWNYLSTSVPAAVTLSFALANAMGGIPELPLKTMFPADTVVGTIQRSVSQDVQFQALSVKAIYDVEDFYEIPYVPYPAGTVSGESMSPVMALGFRSSRSRTDIRRGTKRFVGVPESYAGSGGIIGGAGATAAANIANVMSLALTYDDEGNDLTFTPIIVSKQKYQVPDKDTEAYRYYPTLAEQMEHIAQSIQWQPYSQARSQTSRQYGRGQ